MSASSLRARLDAAEAEDANQIKRQIVFTARAELESYAPTDLRLALEVVELLKAIQPEINERFAGRDDWAKAIMLFNALDAFEASP